MNETAGDITDILQNIPDAVIVLDQYWCFTYANDKAGQLFGKTKSFLIGKNIWTTFTHYGQTTFYDACCIAKKEQQPSSTETYFAFNKQWFDINIAPSPDTLTLFIRNITERKNKEEKLNQSEKRFRALIENNDSIVSLIDENLNVLFRNSSAARVTGWTNEEYASMSGSDNIHPDDARHVKAVIAASVKNPATALPILFRVKHKNENYIWLEGVIINKMNDPYVNGILTNLRDVTERIDAEKKLQDEKVLSDKIINSLPGIFYMADTTPKLLHWNRELELVTGYSACELETIAPVNLFAPAHHARFFDATNKVYSTGAGNIEIKLVSKNGNTTNYYFTGVKAEYLGKPAMLGIGIDISEQRKAEKEIRKSSERFALTTMATNDMIWDWNLLTDELWWNYNYNSLFGYDNQTMHHINSWVNSVHPDDRKRVKEGIYSIINSGKKFWSDEYRYLKKDGTVLNIYDRGYVSYNDEGKPYRMIGSMLNITDRIKAEQAVKASEEKYRTLVEQASDAIYISNMQGRIITVNPSACTLSGYCEAELLNMSIYDFVSADELEKKPFRFEELMQGKTVLINRKFRMKNGDLLDVECIANMLSDGRILVFARNITERIKAEEALKNSEEKYRTLVEQASDAIYIMDISGRMLTVNKSACKLSQYTEQELLQMSVFDFMNPSYYEENPVRFDELKKGNTVIAERILKRKNGQFLHVENTAKMLSDGRILVFARDISERIKAQKLLEKSHKDIRRLAIHLTQVREEERKRIGREIHDELGQRLTAIKMDVAWIDKKTPDENSPIKNNLKNIISLLDGTNKSIRRILTELSPGIIDDNGLLDAIARLNSQFTATTGTVIEFTTAESKINLSQPIANCIFRVYQESLTNIMRYAGAGKVLSSLTITAGSIVVTIEDDGNGFDTETVQTKKSFGILGMRERVFSQKGKFELHSEKTKGTKITITLPYKQH